MSYVEIEVRAKTVDLAVEAAMRELGVDDKELVAVEVTTEPVKGFLGIGGQDAVVRVKRRQNRRRRSNRRKPQTEKRQKNPESKGSPQNRQRSGAKSGKNGAQRNTSRAPGKSNPGRNHAKREKTVSDDRPVLPVEEQVKIAQDFLEGLLGVYGLEGEVVTKVEEGVIIADVIGEQTEALVGIRGTVRLAIHELTRTVLQRYGQGTARFHLDIAGYAERRRQALSIYAEQLIEQLKSEAGEIMLEPMSPPDRKVMHEIAALHEGIESYSEGEPPRRFVVLSKVDLSEEE